MERWTPIQLSLNLYDLFLASQDTTYGKLGTLVLGDVYFHADFIAVAKDSEGYQVGDPKFPDATSHYYQVWDGLEPDGGFQSVMIDGQDYVLVIYPYSE